MSRLFEIQKMDGKMYLIYSAPNSLMPAGEFGKAVIGFEACLKEAARIGVLHYDGVFIEAIQQGSVKSVFKYIKKNPLAVVVTLDLIVNLINNSFSLIDRFGANNFKNPNKHILEQISDKRVLELCRSYDFRSGLQKIAEPINEANGDAEIIIGESTLKITRENKYKFYVEKEEEPILPELKNGDEATIVGEITRINKKYNDIGFNYKGYSLSATPIDKEINISSYHELLETDMVELTGIVIRDSYFQVPKIKITHMASYVDPQLVLFKNDSK